MQKAETPALVVFSGGTAFNSIAGEGAHLPDTVFVLVPSRNLLQLFN